MPKRQMRRKENNMPSRKAVMAPGAEWRQCEPKDYEEQGECMALWYKDECLFHVWDDSYKDHVSWRAAPTYALVGVSPHWEGEQMDDAFGDGQEHASREEAINDALESACDYYWNQRVCPTCGEALGAKGVDLSVLKKSARIENIEDYAKKAIVYGICIDGKAFYIGKSQKPVDRLTSHFSGEHAHNDVLCEWEKVNAGKIYAVALHEEPADGTKEQDERLWKIERGYLLKFAHSLLNKAGQGRNYRWQPDWVKKKRKTTVA